MEIWKTVIINNIEWNYKVSNMGKVIVTSTNKPRSLCTREYVSLTLFHNSIPKYCQVPVGPAYKGYELFIKTLINADYFTKMNFKI
jgi:hypothetical protein